MRKSGWEDFGKRVGFSQREPEGFSLFLFSFIRVGPRRYKVHIADTYILCILYCIVYFRVEDPLNPTPHFQTLPSSKSSFRDEFGIKVSLLPYIRVKT
jgi:hypothetical protein